MCDLEYLDNLKVIDFEKCGNVVRFYLGSLDCDQYWGDDWDDVPYEHNAGTVYDKFVMGYIDVAWNLDTHVLEPCDHTVNSSYSKQLLIERQVPMIITKQKSKDSGYWDYGRFAELCLDADQKFYYNEPASELILKCDSIVGSHLNKTLEA